MVYKRQYVDNMLTINTVNIGSINTFLTQVSTAVLIFQLMLGKQQEYLFRIGGQALHHMRHGAEG